MVFVQLVLPVRNLHHDQLLRHLHLGPRHNDLRIATGRHAPTIALLLVSGYEVREVPFIVIAHIILVHHRLIFVSILHRFARRHSDPKFKVLDRRHPLILSHVPLGDIIKLLFHDLVRVGQHSLASLVY